MVLNKNKGKQVKIKNYDMNHFGNNWGLFVDIENQKINLPNNHEILRERYNIQFYNYCDESIDETIDDIDEKLENKSCINLVIKATTTTSIILIITFIVIFIL